MNLCSVRRGALPVTLGVLLTFGCATVRSPASGIGEEVQVGENGAGSQVELWLESAGPVSEAEKAQAVAQVRSALDRATATLVSDDGGETLLVVRAQGIARTGSRKANQQAAKVGIVVGAVALIAVVVVAAVAGSKGGGGSGPKLGGLKAAPARIAPPRGGAFRAAPPRFSLPVAAGRGRVRSGPVLVGVHAEVPVPVVDQLQVQPMEPPPGQPIAAGPVMEPEERTAFPPKEPVTLRLPRPPPLDPSRRKFFDKDFTRLELLVVDRDTGRATWVKRIEGPVDPRDPEAVRALVAQAIGDPGGWELMAPAPR